MNQHDELMWYLETFLGIAMEHVPSYTRFMANPYLKLCDDTFCELLVEHDLKNL